MTRNSITIEDVAKAAGVSRQTVSRVINQRTNVAKSSRERVEQAIAELGYVPNAAARRMGGARSFVLLAVIERGAGADGAGGRTGRLPIDAMLLAGLEACSQAGYHLLFEQLDAGPAASLAQLNRALTALSPDGVVLTPPLDERADIRAALDTRAIACETLSERAEFGRAAPGMDDAAMSEAATTHLIDLGHRQIGFVAGVCHARRSERRVGGYRRVMAAKGSRAHVHFTSEKPLNFEQAKGLARSWLVPTIRPTAIIAETEEVAHAIVEVARDIGLSVPNELSILSLEERANLARLTPPVTAYSQPYHTMFAQSCARLIARAQEADSASQTTGMNEAETPPTSPFECVERQSVAKAPRAV